MLVLDTTSRTLQLILGGAVAANELPFVASYIDVAAPDTYQPGSQHGLSNGAADVTIVAAPAAGKVRQLKFLSIYNRDTAVVTVTVKLDDAATQRELIKVAALPVGGALIYTDGEGFRVLNAAGAVT